MSVRLLVKSRAASEQPPQELILAEEQIIVGRDKACPVVLNDSVVSRRHASIVREGALYFLEDLNSSHGTRVNGAGLPAGEKRLLRNGDTIAIGPYDVVFDKLADEVPAGTGETGLMAKRVLKDALRGPSGGGPCLRVMNGPLEGTRLEVHDAQELIIGREKGVDLTLDDDLASRRHAKIRCDWSGTYVEDLQSRNGVKVNRRKIAGAQQLSDRDEIEIGSTRLLYLDPTAVGEVEVPQAPSAEEPEEAPPEEQAPEEQAAPEAPPPAEEPAAEEAAAEEQDASQEGEGEASDEGSPPGEEEGQAYEQESSPDDAPRSGKPGLAGRLDDLRGDVQQWLPYVVVGCIALCALVTLAITFFAM